MLMGSCLVWKKNPNGQKLKQTCLVGKKNNQKCGNFKKRDVHLSITLTIHSEHRWKSNKVPRFLSRVKWGILLEEANPHCSLRVRWQIVECLTWNNFDNKCFTDGKIQQTGQCHVLVDGWKKSPISTNISRNEQHWNIQAHGASME